MSYTITDCIPNNSPTVAADFFAVSVLKCVQDRYKSVKRSSLAAAIELKIPPLDPFWVRE